MEREKPADSRDNCQESIAAGSTALMGRPGNQPGKKKRRNTALRQTQIQSRESVNKNRKHVKLSRKIINKLSTYFRKRQRQAGVQGGSVTRLQGYTFVYHAKPP